MTNHRTLVLLLLALASPAIAQEPGVVSYELHLFQGGSAPVQVYPFDPADVVCGETRPAPATQPIINPTKIFWADEAVPGSDCVHDTSTSSGVLFSLPVGTYDGRLVAINLAGASGLSALSPPFSRLDPLPAPTGVRLGH